MDWTSAGAFFKDPTFDYETRIALGAVSQGIGDTGLVLATIGRITDGDPQSWFDAWVAAAEKADNLTASTFFGKALVVADTLGTDQTSTFQRQFGAWEAYVGERRFVRVDVPYEGTTLPGYLLRPDDSGAPRPTLVMTNGSDGSMAGLVGYGAGEALRRGWNAFVFDGPGQQSMLFQRGVPFRYDWEAVLTPVIDALVARPDVDADRLTGYGISQGGYWLPRALAFEHRLKAAVADGGVVDVSRTWNKNLPPQMLDLLRDGQKDTFNGIMASIGGDPAQEREFAFRSRPYGQDNPFDTFRVVQQFRLGDEVPDIRTPMLVLAPDDDQFFAGQELYDRLPGEKKLVHFTAATGANWHCQPLARQQTHRAMFEFLAAHVPR
jgi:hypothetical protein